MNKQRLQQMRPYFIVGAIQGGIWAALIGFTPSWSEKVRPWLYWLGLLTGGWVMWHDARNNQVLTDIFNQVADTITGGPGSRTPPEKIAEYCQILADMQAHKEEYKCTWPEVEEQFGTQYNKDWRKYWREICEKRLKGGGIG